MQRRHAAACRLFLFKRAGFSARHLKKQGTLPAAPPGKRAQPALNGNFPHKGNSRTFLPQAKKARRGGKGAAPQGFERADTEGMQAGDVSLRPHGKKSGRKGLFLQMAAKGAWGEQRCSPHAPFVLREVHGVFEEIIFEGFPRPLR